MDKIIETMFSGFFAFIGMFLLIYVVLHYVVNGMIQIFNLTSIWSRFMRMLMVRKHGWPPPHLDADGDWKQELKNNIIGE